MKEIIISIPDKEYTFVMELLNRLSFIEVKGEESEDQCFLKGLEEALEEVNAIKLGKKEGKSLQAFLDEL